MFVGLPVAALGGCVSKSCEGEIFAFMSWAVQVGPVVCQVCERGGDGCGAQRQYGGSFAVEYGYAAGCTRDVDCGLNAGTPCSQDGCRKRLAGFVCGCVCKSDGPQALF